MVTVAGCNSGPSTLPYFPSLRHFSGWWRQPQKLENL